MKKQIYTIVTLLSMVLNTTLLAEDNTVKICNDSGEWAPYFYHQRDSNGEKKEKIVGATVDVLDAIFKKIKLEHKFELLPWKRCLAYVKRFDKAQKYEMFSEAGINTQRLKDFIPTKEPIYKRTNVFYYNKDKFPNGIKIKTVKDMENYKICVGSGLSFERYIKAGLKPSFIDTSHKTDYFDVIRKISLGYCDIMPANLAIVEGGKKVKQFNIPKNITYIDDITINDPFYYHFWISKKSERANELINKIDNVIVELKKSGEWEKIFKKHLPNGSGL